MAEVCPLCVRDDGIATEFIAPGLRRYTCSNKHGDGGSYEWKGPDLADLEGSGSAANEGIMADIGLLDDLGQCVFEGEGWIEYGIVEDRYERLSPKEFAELCERYGHHHKGEKRSPNQFTASALIAKGLGMLRDRGVLEFRYAKATGPWSYNGEISYWAKPPRPIEANETTYEAQQSRDV